MTAKPQKPQSVVTVHIEAGKPTPAQREAWRRTWGKLIAKASEAAKNE